MYIPKGTGADTHVNLACVNSRKYGLPIFTVNIFGSKMYVVASPELIQSIQKQHKQLSMTLIRLKLTIGLCGVSEKARKLIELNADGAEGDWGVFEESFDSMHATLSPGTSLDDVNQSVVGQVASQLNGQDPGAGQLKPIGLWEWTKEIITEATAFGIYGSEHPFRDPDIIKAFW